MSLRRMHFRRLEWISIHIQKKIRKAETTATVILLDSILKKKTKNFLREELLLTSPPPHKITPVSKSKHLMSFSVLFVQQGVCDC